MTATACTNGKPQRKQLADQLDRLDSIIDALAEGLNGAVADACREGTRLAVKDAIVEILTNPELRAMLVPQAAPAPAAAPVPEPKKPGLWGRIKATVTSAKYAAVSLAARAKTAVAAKCAAVTAPVAALGAVTGEALPVRRALGAALGVGLVVALACSQMPESVSAAAAGIGAACTAVAAQVGFWIKRAARRVGLLG